MNKKITVLLVIIILSALSIYAMEDDEFLFKKSMKFFHLKKFDYAVDGLNELINEYPDSTFYEKALYYKGVSMFYLYTDKKENSLEAIEEIFREILDKFPTGEFCVPAAKWIGDIYYLTGEYDTAITKYNEMLDKFKSTNMHDKILYNLAKCNEKKEMYILAKTILERILIKYPETNLKKQIDFDIKRLNEIIAAK